MNLLKQTKKRLVRSNHRVYAIPYKRRGLWVFDDEDRDLYREAPVGGTDRLIEAACRRADIPEPDDGVLVLFSAGPFPGADIVLDWVRGEADGDVYRWEEAGLEGWLCPNLALWYEPPPKKLYVSVRGIAPRPAKVTGFCVRRPGPGSGLKGGS